MIIDDSPFDRLIAEKVVTLSGIADTCTVFNSAVDALKYLKIYANCPVHFPDVIFVDISMPAMDGFEFVSEFEKISGSGSAECSVYILSSSADPNDIRKSEKSAVINGFIIKPLTVEKAKSFLTAYMFKLN